MKKLLSIVFLVCLASTLTSAEEYPFWRPGQDGYNGPRSQHRHHQRPHQRHYTCPVDYKPVCGKTRQNIAATYHNQCYAEQDGAHVIDPNDQCPIFNCPQTYEPVCARPKVGGFGPPGGPPGSSGPPPPQTQGQGPPGPGAGPDQGRRFRLPPGRQPPPSYTGFAIDIRPFLNECVAKQTSYEPLLSYADRRHRYIDYRYIQGDTIDFNTVCPRTCPGRIDLVCGEDETGRLRLYANRCSAILEGATFVKRGVCSGR